MTDHGTSLKLRVFVSSVQKELTHERTQLKVLLTTDPFLLRCTVPKLFEKYPAPLRPDSKAYLKLLDKCQIYLLIIGKEYGARGRALSATHQEYKRAQELSLPTLVCVKGDSKFERDKREIEFFETVKEDGHTYSRFKNIEELHEVVRKRLIEHIKESYELTPSKEDQAVAEVTLIAASPFDRQRVHRALQELQAKHLTSLAQAVDPESRKSLRPKDREQLLLERGYLWFNNAKNTSHPTAAGILLAGKDPTAEFPQARIQLDIYKGNSTDDEALIAEPIQDNIPNAINTIVTNIYRNTRTTPRIVGLKRLDMPEYPEEALREALLNALAHRDYEDASQRVFVEVFYDRMVVTNPGRPVGHPSLKRLEKGKARSRSRNPLISQGLVFLKLMEERGTGIRRMRRAMQDYGLEPPHVELDDDRFLLTLPGPGEHLDRIKAPVTEGSEIRGSIAEELNKRQTKIAQRLASGEELSSSQLQKDFGLTRDTIARDMSVLISLGLARKTGKARATRYIHAQSESSGIVR